MLEKNNVVCKFTLFDTMARDVRRRPRVFRYKLTQRMFSSSVVSINGKHLRSVNCTGIYQTVRCTARALPPRQTHRFVLPLRVGRAYSRVRLRVETFELRLLLVHHESQTELPVRHTTGRDRELDSREVGFFDPCSPGTHGPLNFRQLPRLQPRLKPQAHLAASANFMGPNVTWRVVNFLPLKW